MTSTPSDGTSSPLGRGMARCMRCTLRCRVWRKGPQERSDDVKAGEVFVCFKCPKNVPSLVLQKLSSKQDLQQSKRMNKGSIRTGRYDLQPNNKRNTKKGRPSAEKNNHIFHHPRPTFFWPTLFQGVLAIWGPTQLWSWKLRVERWAYNHTRRFIAWDLGFFLGPVDSSVEFPCESRLLWPKWDQSIPLVAAVGSRNCCWTSDAATNTPWFFGPGSAAENWSPGLGCLKVLSKSFVYDFGVLSGINPNLSQLSASLNGFFLLFFQFLPHPWLSAWLRRAQRSALKAKKHAAGWEKTRWWLAVSDQKFPTLLNAKQKIRFSNHPAGRDDKPPTKMTCSKTIWTSCY